MTTISNKTGPANFFPARRPHARTKYNPSCVDPHKRLLVAIAAQAVVDLLWPNQKMGQGERAEALAFVLEHRDLYINLGIPAQKLDALVRYAQKDRRQ